MIKNIFAIERKGEAEKISKWKNTENKLFLFHGKYYLLFKYFNKFLHFLLIF